MAEPFLGEMKINGFNFAPKGWATCDGQILPITQNSALFSLLGTYYGGNGTSTFALPDFRGRTPMHWGQGSGLSGYSIGENGGAEAVSILVGQMPSHTHTLGGASSAGAVINPSGAMYATAPAGATVYGAAQGQSTSLAPGTIGTSAGGSVPHQNMQPFLTLNFCIALAGIYPSRS